MPLLLCDCRWQTLPLFITCYDVSCIVGCCAACPHLERLLAYWIPTPHKYCKYLTVNGLYFSRLTFHFRPCCHAHDAFLPLVLQVKTRSTLPSPHKSIPETCFFVSQLKWEIPSLALSSLWTSQIGKQQKGLFLGACLALFRLEVLSTILSIADVAVWIVVAYFHAPDSAAAPYAMDSSSQ